MTIPEEALTASPFYREIMRPQGWRHAVALCFWGEPSSEFPVLVVTVNRGEQRPDFSEQEIRRLARIHAVLDGWVTDIFEHAAAEQAYRSVTTIVDRDAKGILVLDWKFRSTFANSAAAKLCAVWDGSVPRPDPTGTRRVRVPPMLLTACRDLYSEWRGTLRGSGGTSRSGRAVNVVHPVMRMLSARVSIRYPDANGLAEPSFVIELHRRHPAPAAVRRVPLDSLVTLTRAEQEVARALGDGLSNQEIAERLGKTVYAVKFLLHRTYRRLGIANRTQLASVIRRAEVKRSG
jgi:DNA-binding CsgD family transcriptional regulator